MCTYLTKTFPAKSTAFGSDGWFEGDRVTVFFDHPQRIGLDHALCIDVATAADPSRRIALELSAPSARELAAAILAVLDAPETQELTTSET